MKSVRAGLAALVLTLAPCAAAVAADDDGQKTAALFGAREDVEDVSLSPDGTRLAYRTPLAGQGSALYVVGTEEGAKPQFVTSIAGKPERLGGCNWVAADRLVCTLHGVVEGQLGLMPFSRVIAIDASGDHVKMLSTVQQGTTHDFQFGGGEVVDWLPDEDGAVLMARNYVRDTELGSRAGSDKDGYAVDRLDTRTLAVKAIEAPDREAVGYISDGRGTVRIKARHLKDVEGYSTGDTLYFYRLPDQRAWQPLPADFTPLSVDHDHNLAYGVVKQDGRKAIVSLTLDGALHRETVYARPDVDVEDLISIGRRNRAVGVSYVSDKRNPVFFDPQIRKIADSLSKALPNQPIAQIVDSSVDETKLLIFAGSDTDPGAYYLLDRTTHHLQTLVNKRDALLGMTLGAVKPMTYPAADGTVIPAYLTLPPGKENAKGLPAIVLPHGGPAARDEWGFDWLSQFYAARGYAVLQPEFRGSAGYGDVWFQKNGFKSWKVAIGDVLDAGRWLVAQGIADPAKLAVVGWSYGGYAALQSAVVDPGLFKAVVAIAPVTDLAAFKEEWHNWSNFYAQSDFIGSGPYIREASPAQNAQRIAVPVLMFHGTLDRNVGVAESRLMAARLKAAGARYELVTWDGLDHYCEDSAARTAMLAKSDAFLRAAMGL